MRLPLFLALCAFATALPSADVDPAIVVPESAPEAPDMNLMEASYNDAKDTITALVQQGKEDSACRDMAKATAAQVTSSVADEQKVLAGMDNGDSCDDEGQGLIDTANKNREDADEATLNAQKALTDAKSEKFNFGDFDYNSLVEGQCNTFFMSQTWKDAKGKVTVTQSTYNTKVAEAKAAATAVQTAKDEAKSLVQKCKCKAKKALDDALKSMNKNAKEANTKAWNKAYHMQCVLDGKTTQNCDVPALPTVQTVPYGTGVEKACGRGEEKMWYSQNVASKSGYKFKLFRMPPQTGFSMNKSGQDTYEKVCKAHGLKMIGCGTHAYPSQNYPNRAVAMPTNWGCNMMTPMCKESGLCSEKPNCVALMTYPDSTNWLYTDGPKGVDTSKPDQSLAPICGCEIGRDAGC